MIIEVSIAGEQPHRYEVRRSGGHIVVRHLDQENTANGSSVVHETSINWRRPQPGIYSLLVDNASHEVFIEQERDLLAVHLAKRTFAVRAVDIRRRQTATVDTAIGDGSVAIIAPIPGRVTRVLVEVGQPVTRGTGIIVVEAMKMENELRAPRDGIVGAIEVEEGQGVDGGTLLAVIE